MSEERSWLDRLSETVDKATKAAGEAWEGTADIRKEAWEKTKAAGSTASAAIEEGVEKAQNAYKSGQAGEPEAASVDVVDTPDDETVVAGDVDESEVSPADE
ncbi:MAG: hypothetical protein ABFS21_10345 [Actinomycetota bacterium]